MLQKEAAIRPHPERHPPTIMMGRLPYLFTRMLLMGPGKAKETWPEMSYFCTGDQTSRQAPRRATAKGLQIPHGDTSPSEGTGVRGKDRRCRDS